MNHLVIAIGREFGSGGKEISQKVADRLQVRCYDNELLSPNTYHISNYAAARFSEMPLNHKVFLAQFEAIKNLAKRESCVIVGRCADYALAENPMCFSFFIHADMDFRIARVKKDVDIEDEVKLADYITKADKKRANYYHYYSGKKWGDARSYDVCIDSSRLGIEQSVDLILSYVKIRCGERFDD